MSIKDRPAFPVISANTFSANHGLTKLEYFAGLAMQANRARGSAYNNWGDLAKDSVEIAKALIEELEKHND